MKKENKLFVMENTPNIPTTAKKAKNFFKAHKKAFSIAFASIVLAIGLFFVTTEYFIPSYHYSKAVELIDEENYTEAYTHLRKCHGFKDSVILLKHFVVVSEKEMQTSEETRLLFHFSPERYRCKTKRLNNKRWAF